MASEETLERIDPGALVDEYRERGLESWSDDRLVSAVADVIAVPRQDQADSFILHAPLELIARRRLLQMVEPSARRLARLHIVAIAANYQAFGSPADQESSGGSAGVIAGIDVRPLALLAAVEAGDLAAVDRAAQLLTTSRIDPVDLVRSLGPALLARTAAAGHAPIFLAVSAERWSGRSGVTPDDPPAGPRAGKTTGLEDRLGRLDSRRRHDREPELGLRPCRPARSAL